MCELAAGVVCVAIVGAGAVSWGLEIWPKVNGLGASAAVVGGFSAGTPNLNVEVDVDVDSFALSNLNVGSWGFGSVPLTTVDNGFAGEKLNPVWEVIGGANENNEGAGSVLSLSSVFFSVLFSRFSDCSVLSGLPSLSSGLSPGLLSDLSLVLTLGSCEMGEKLALGLNS